MSCQGFVAVAHLRSKKHDLLEANFCFGEVTSWSWLKSIHFFGRQLHHCRLGIFQRALVAQSWSQMLSQVSIDTLKNPIVGLSVTSINFFFPNFLQQENTQKTMQKPLHGCKVVGNFLIQLPSIENPPLTKRHAELLSHRAWCGAGLWSYCQCVCTLGFLLRRWSLVHHSSMRTTPIQTYTDAASLRFRMEGEFSDGVSFSSFCSSDVFFSVQNCETTYLPIFTKFSDLNQPPGQSGTNVHLSHRSEERCPGVLWSS